MVNEKQSPVEIEERLRYQIEMKSGMSLAGLAEFGEEHLFALIENKATALSELFKGSGAKRSRARTIVGSGTSDSYQDIFLYFGLSEHFVRLLNPKKRYDYLISSGYGKTLILDYASRLLKGKSSNQTAIELAGKLTQTQLKEDTIIKHLFGANLGNTTTLRKALGLVEGDLSQPTWPQGFLKKYPIAAKEAFEKTKDELLVKDLDWKEITSKYVREKTTYGARLLDKFDNSINKMVEYFDYQPPHNVVRSQNALQNPDVIKEMIVRALEVLNKPLSDLPNISVRELSDKAKLGSYLSTISRIYNKTHPQMMCKLFPDQNWNIYDFKASGVPDHYWFDDVGNLNVEAATEAIESVLEKRFYPNDIDTPEKRLEKLGRLSQIDMNFYGFSVLASPSCLSNGESWTWPSVLKKCFPEVVIYRDRIKSALIFIQRLKQNGMIPGDLDPFMHVEKRSLKTDVSYLFDDLHLFIDVNGSTKNIVFELQGPQHFDKNHRYFTDSVLENDVKKFVYHYLNEQQIYYVTSEALYKNTYFYELKSQGLDIENERMEERDVLMKAKQLEDDGFVAKGFYEKVRERLNE